MQAGLCRGNTGMMTAAIYFAVLKDLEEFSFGNQGERYQRIQKSLQNRRCAMMWPTCLGSTSVCQYPENEHSRVNVHVPNCHNILSQGNHPQPSTPNPKPFTLVLDLTYGDQNHKPLTERARERTEGNRRGSSGARSPPAGNGAPSPAGSYALRGGPGWSLANTPSGCPRMGNRKPSG